MNNMTEQEQNTQKTIVAFVAGLLVGGLLVWIFSSPTETKTDSQDADMAVGTEQSVTQVAETGDAADFSGSTGQVDSNGNETVTVSKDMEIGNGDISVSDQSAGDKVVLDSAVFPSDEGWIGVRDYQNGDLGNILGVARFSKEQNLIPSEVSLLRTTIAGNTYAVVFFTENGDHDFNLADDRQLDSVVATFVAN